MLFVAMATGRMVVVMVDILGVVGNTTTFLEGDLGTLKVRTVCLGTEDQEEEQPDNDRADHNTLNGGIIGLKGAIDVDLEPLTCDRLDLDSRRGDHVTELER